MEHTDTAPRGRDSSTGKYLPGHGGGPGRPKGSPNANNVHNAKIHEYKAILDARTSEILDIVIDAALSSDLVAARMVLNRVYPAQQAAVLELHTQLDTLREQLDAHQAAQSSH